MNVRWRATWVVRWGGLASLLSVAGLWLVSGWWSFQAVHYGEKWTSLVACGRGAVCFVSFDFSGETMRNDGEILLRRSRLRPTATSTRWMMSAFQIRPRVRRAVGPFTVNLYILMVASAVPTGYAWYRHRRLRPGHCRKCRYNLAGVTGDVCPECGAERLA